MTSSHRVRFRLWHLFALVAIAAICVWSFTQVGMETAEIEIIAVGSFSDNGVANDPNAPQEIVKVVFQYLRPDDLSDTRLNLFLHSPTALATRISVGDRITFRYRARPLVWLEPNKPDPIAIRHLGLERDDIEEVIVETRMSGEIAQRDSTRNTRTSAAGAGRGN